MGLWGEGKAVTMIRPGTVFEIPDGFKLGSWMEKVEEEPAKKPAPATAAKAPPAKAFDTMSALAKHQANEEEAKLKAKTASLPKP